jgi:hypothetical protein
MENEMLKPDQFCNANDVLMNNEVRIDLSGEEW